MCSPRTILCLLWRWPWPFPHSGGQTQKNSAAAAVACWVSPRWHLRRSLLPVQTSVRSLVVPCALPGSVLIAAGVLGWVGVYLGLCCCVCPQVRLLVPVRRGTVCGRSSVWRTQQPCQQPCLSKNGCAWRVHLCDINKQVTRAHGVSCKEGGGRKRECVRACVCVGDGPMCS